MAEIGKLVIISTKGTENQEKEKKLMISKQGKTNIK